MINYYDDKERLQSISDWLMDFDFRIEVVSITSVMPNENDWSFFRDLDFPPSWQQTPIPFMPFTEGTHDG